MNFRASDTHDATTATGRANATTTARTSGTERANATPVPDQSERDRIIGDTDRTLFVNAGAGSGKTRSLVERIRTLVLEDEVPMLRIAAVTFTEKAGAELRDRLRGTFEEVWRTGEGHPRDLAARALDELDRAAVGTLHSFAQRILTEHAIAAGLPPQVEVLDAVASSVAFDTRWADLQRELLDDDTVADPLLLGMAAGLTLDHVRSLTRALGSDWDLIEERILRSDPPAVTLPDLSGFRRQAQELLDQAQHCIDPDDNLLKKFPALDAALLALNGAVDDGARVAALQQVSQMKFTQGRKPSWTCDINEVRAAGKDLVATADAIVRDLLDRVLRGVTHWTARRVVTAAHERRRDGRLEFHDLLVLARDLLLRDREVRAALHQSYERLLLDEFQDTDPIQIELAVRIAGGAEAGAEDWADVDVPDGRLFFVGDAKQSIYRFRRADIAMYLRAQQRLGTPVSLTTNFRTVDPILQWVNHVFDRLIQEQDGAQPRYEALAPYRMQAGTGPAVTVLGTEAHEGKPKADELRTLEAADVASSIRTMLAQGWQVRDDADASWRPVEHKDIAILVPARTSLPFLEDALIEAGVPYRADASSLVYQATEVRALMAAARAIADPGDEFSLVTALRSPLFGCGDDDLWRWRSGGGSFALWSRQERVEEPLRQDSPVAHALKSLQALARRARWATSAEVLEEIITDRRMYEVGASGADRRDVWRRLGFVVDQARAWSQATRGGLRAYLAWAAHQADDSSRVSESVLPETDVDAVRISTIHAAKGLEYPVVVLSGMSTQPRRPSGVQLLWPPDGGYAVRLGSSIETSEFSEVQPIDEQMGDAERMRLLYVAATRARDHLVVSLHRAEGSKDTAAALMAGAGGADAGLATRLEDLGVVVESDGTPAHEPPVPVPTYEEWSARVGQAVDSAQCDAAVVASGLEGTEPEVVLRAEEDEAGRHKGPRDLALPPWSKGRYGSAVGRAVHGVLQTVDLTATEPAPGEVEAQCVAEGVTAYQDLVTALVRSALASPLVATAAHARHWRESYVGTVQEDGTVLEGYVDLIFEDDDGTLVIVDYKTDAIPAGALDTRVAYYQPQLQAYATCLQDATGRPVRCELLFLHPDRAVARSVPLAMVPG